MPERYVPDAELLTSTDGSAHYRRVGVGEYVRTDASLLAYAVKNAAMYSTLPVSRRAAVADTFGIGFSSAAQLCRRFGLDPDEVVKR